MRAVPLFVAMQMRKCFWSRQKIHKNISFVCTF